ncbi:MAG: class I SAM-dependent methyltransferase, partial [Candidatus Hydrogenedentes bacterium]|nr:class I SAM-dependent methyltransferase [Candidatus Hydrogenedentota bacterium]
TLPNQPARKMAGEISGLTCPASEYLGQFHAVVAFDVLEHIPDDRAALAGIRRLLESGGNAYVHVPGGDINAPLDENDKKHGHVRHGYSESQIRAVIDSQVWTEKRYLKTFSPAELKAYHMALKGWVTAGRKKLAKCPFDGKEGKCHLFVLTK